MPSMKTQRRVGAGVPAGGEFARTSHAPSDITLDDGTASTDGAGDETAQTPDRPFAAWSPVQVDTEIARISTDLYRAEDRAREVRRRIAEARDYRRRNRLSEEQLAARVVSLQPDLDAAQVEVDRQLGILAPYDDEFSARGGWPRGWYVPGGHIHASTGCSTLRATTQIGLVVELSGLTEDEIVDQAGETACTCCYPDAPVDVLNRAPKVQLPDRVEAERLRAEREAAKAAKAAKAAVNTLNWGGTEPVMDDYGRPYSKVSVARSELQSSIFYGHVSHLPLNIAAGGRDVVEAHIRMNLDSRDADEATVDHQIARAWKHSQRVSGLYAVLVEKRVELGATEEQAITAMNKSLTTSMRKNFGMTPNLTLMDEEGIRRSQEWAAGVLSRRRPSDR